MSRRLSGLGTAVTSQNKFQFSNGIKNGNATDSDHRRSCDEQWVLVNRSRRNRSAKAPALAKEKYASDTEYQRRRRRVVSPFPTHRRTKPPSKHSSVGNRRVPSLLWRSGLREPKRSSVRLSDQRKKSEFFSLFVDKFLKVWRRHGYKASSNGLVLWSISTSPQKCEKRTKTALALLGIKLWRKHKPPFQS